MTIINKESKGFIFGGFAGTSWNSNGEWIQSSGNKSFLFTLKNPNPKIKPLKLGIIGNPKYELWGYSYDGPIFGGGTDLQLNLTKSFFSSSSASWCNLGKTYSANGLKYKSKEARNFLAGSEKFKLKEVEIFTEN